MTVQTRKPSISVFFPAYNVGGPAPVSLREIAETLLEIIGKGSVTTVPFPPDRKRIDVGDFYTHFTRIDEELGWCPRTRLREGLERTLLYYQANLDHYLPMEVATA